MSLFSEINPKSEENDLKTEISNVKNDHFEK